MLVLAMQFSRSRHEGRGRKMPARRPALLAVLRGMLPQNRREDGASDQLGVLLVRAELLRKEVIQPHLPVRLPCYDFTPIADPTFDSSLPKGWATGFGCYRLSWCDGRCVQGPGTYSPRRC
jgi:hypothetical protein